MKVDSEIMRIRMPAALKAWLKVQAEKNRRSQNSEIVFRLSADWLESLGNELEALETGAECQLVVNWFKEPEI